MRNVVVLAVLGSSLLASAHVRAQEEVEQEEVEGVEVEQQEPVAPSPDLSALEARVAELEARLTAATDEPASREDDEEDEEEEADDEEDAPPPYTIGGWVEAYYAWNFNDPSNGITDLRGFDNRHDSVNLSNVALDAQWDIEGVHGRVTLQWGSTPATYYLAETAGPSAGTGVGAQNLALWQILQQANIGYRIPIGGGLDVSGGLFLSPCGAEGMNVKDGWFYSRSNLFYGFPFYHTGLRVSYPLTPEVSAHVWLINGWNTLLDNNGEKSLMGQLTWTTDLVSGSFLYISGVERPDGAPEGRAWRHTFDLNSTFTLTEWLGLQGQVTAMVEPNDFGTSAALAGALAARVLPVEWLALSARGDFFWESVASNPVGTASSIFWPSEWVSSFTGSAELRVANHLSFRVEYRHDHAAGPSYFAGTVLGNGTDMPFVRNASTQDTLTLGATAWF